MADIGKSPWYRHPGRVAGALVIAYFAVKFLILLHLTVIGRLVPGHSGRLTGSDSPAPGAPVIYFYVINDTSYSGWRRGIEYGGQDLSVVYSPIVPSLHLCSVRTDLASPWSLWSEIDVWLRATLAVLGITAGVIILIICNRIETRKWTVMHGLERTYGG